MLQAFGRRPPAASQRRLGAGQEAYLPRPEFDIVDCMGRLDLEGDSLASEQRVEW